jgi:DNA-binding NarL/FixJ family response regulator
MPEPISAAMRDGFKAYLTKPLEVAAFLRCIDEVLAANLIPARSAPATPSPPGRGPG